MNIICVQCKKPLYDCAAIGKGFSGDRVRPQDFIPLSDEVPVPKGGDNMLCPYCQKFFVGVSSRGGISLMLEGGAWWPHPPIKTS